MSEARDGEEAARSIRWALYDLQRGPGWSGGATRVEIVSYCLAQKIPTPERFFASAILEIAAEKGYDPTLDQMQYALTPQAERDEQERRGRQSPFIEAEEPRRSEPAEARATRPRSVSAIRPEPPPEREQGRRFTAPAVSAPQIGADAVRLVIAFGLGVLTGLVLSNLV